MCWIVARSNQWQDDDGDARSISDTLVDSSGTNSSTSNLIVADPPKALIKITDTVDETKRVEGDDLAEEKSHWVYVRQHNWDLEWLLTQYGWSTCYIISYDQKWKYSGRSSASSNI